MLDTSYHVKTTPYFTEEHDIFRDQLRKWVIENLQPHADEWEKAKHFPSEVFREMGKMGFLGVSMPEDVGGAGGDIWHTAVFCEELPHCHMAGLTMGSSTLKGAATPR